MKRDIEWEFQVQERVNEQLRNARKLKSAARDYDAAGLYEVASHLRIEAMEMETKAWTDLATISSVTFSYWNDTNRIAVDADIPA